MRSHEEAGTWHCLVKSEIRIRILCTWSSRNPISECTVLRESNRFVRDHISMPHSAISHVKNTHRRGDHLTRPSHNGTCLQHLQEGAWIKTGTETAPARRTRSESATAEPPRRRRGKGRVRPAVRWGCGRVGRAGGVYRAQVVWPIHLLPVPQGVAIRARYAWVPARLQGVREEVNALVDVDERRRSAEGRRRARGGCRASPRPAALRSVPARCVPAGCEHILSQAYAAELYRHRARVFHG